MKLLNNGSIYALGCAFALSACGGGPDLEQIRQDFENPSGSISNQQAVMAVSAKQQSAGPLEEITTTIPGLGLTAPGRTSALTQLNPRFMWESRAHRLYAFLTQGRQRSALSTAQVPMECEQAAEQALQELFSGASGSGDSFSGSASYELDLASCTDDLSGRVKVEVEVEASRDSFEMRVDEELENVCELNSEYEACVTGELVMEVTAESISSTSAQLAFIVGWELDGTWTDGGETRTASLKGGVRSQLSGSENSGRISVEFLFYVNDPGGEEYSYVLEVVAEGNAAGGSLSWRLRGTDGEIECTIQSTGAGACSGTDGQLSWTAEDADGLDPAWLE